MASIYLCNISSTWQGSNLPYTIYLVSTFVTFFHHDKYQLLHFVPTTTTYQLQHPTNYNNQRTIYYELLPTTTTYQLLQPTNYNNQRTMYYELLPTTTTNELQPTNYFLFCEVYRQLRN